MGRPKDPVDHCILGIFMVMGVDVLPDDVALGCDLEHAAEHTFCDQSIAVRQSSCSRDVGTEEVIGRIIEVFPHDPVGLGVDFNHSGEWQRMVVAMGAVVIDQNVPVGQQARVMLLG